MIKCDGFGKLLKQLFSILLISCFIFLGSFSVNAYFNLADNMYVRENGFYGFSPYDNGYDFQVVSKGNLLSQRVGLTLRGIYMKKGTYIVWKYSDYLGGVAPFLSYTNSGDEIASNTIFQGFPTYYSICDYFSGQSIASYDLTGCSVSPLDSASLQFISSFMSGVSNTDFFGFKYGYAYYPIDSQYNNAGVLFCFSSELYNKSMCFGISKHTYTNDVIYPGFNSSNILLYSGYGVGLPSSFDNLYNQDLSMSPGQSFVSGGGGAIEDSGGSSVLTGNFVYSTCSYGDIINMLNSQGFSPYMCYGGIDNFNDYDVSVSYSPIPGTGLKLSQILVNAMNGPRSTPQEWFDYWNGIYNDKKDTTYLSMWSSYPAVYRTWFDLYYQYSDGTKYFDSVREYCSLIDLDIDTTTTYKGQYFKGVCDTIIDQKQYGYTFGGSGEVGLGVNRGLSGEKVQSNAVQFIQDFFNKAQDVIPTNYSDIGLGFLPVYIITFMIALIFFRFLMR